MNLPNSLTVSRFFFAAALMVVLALEFPYAKSAAFIMFVIAAITDYLDGMLARKVYGVTNFGKLMDPLADKVMVSAVLIGLIELPFQQSSPPLLVPAFVVVIIIAREFMVTGLRLLAAGEGTVLSAGKWGKHKAAWQMIAIIIILLGLALREDLLPWIEGFPAWSADFDFWFQKLAWVLMGIVTFLTIISGGIYFYQQREMLLHSA